MKKKTSKPPIIRSNLPPPPINVYHCIYNSNLDNEMLSTKN